MEEKKLDDAKDEDGNTEKAPDNDAEAKAANEALIQRRLEVVSIVCQALEGWCGVEPSAVTVELAAPPKAYIFKVSAKVASPSVVILKFGGGSDSRTAEAETSVGDRRTEAATAMFMTQGICPARLAASDDASWWIEACAGPMLFDFECTGAYTCDDTFDAKHVAHREKLSSAAAEYGRLLGKIHAAPTNWFSPFIEEGVAAYPFLQSLPEAGSFLWLYQYRDEEFKASMTYHSAEPQRLQRLQALTTLQQRAAQEAMVGREVKVLFEKPGRDEGQMVGKSEYLHAVHVTGSGAQPGDILPVRIASSGRNSLAGGMIVVNAS